MYYLAMNKLVLYTYVSFFIKRLVCVLVSKLKMHDYYTLIVMCLFVSNPTRLFFLFWSVKNYKKENNVDVAFDDDDVCIYVSTTICIYQQQPKV